MAPLGRCEQAGVLQLLGPGAGRQRSRTQTAGARISSSSPIHCHDGNTTIHVCKRADWRTAALRPGAQQRPARPTLWSPARSRTPAGESLPRPPPPGPRGCLTWRPPAMLSPHGGRRLARGAACRAEPHEDAAAGRSSRRPVDAEVGGSRDDPAAPAVTSANAAEPAGTPGHAAGGGSTGRRSAGARGVEGPAAGAPRRRHLVETWESHRRDGGIVFKFMPAGLEESAAALAARELLPDLPEEVRLQLKEQGLLPDLPEESL